MKGTPVYKEEVLRERARIDTQEKREEELIEERKMDQNRKLLRNIVIGIAALIIIYLLLYKPLYNMLF